MIEIRGGENCAMTQRVQLAIRRRMGRVLRRCAELDSPPRSICKSLHRRMLTSVVKN